VHNPQSGVLYHINLCVNKKKTFQDVDVIESVGECKFFLMPKHSAMCGGKTAF
jgi:hypothetical protein